MKQASNAKPPAPAGAVARSVKQRRSRRISKPSYLSAYPAINTNRRRAENVMGMDQPSLPNDKFGGSKAPHATLQRKCSSCETEENEGRLQTKSIHQGVTAADETVPMRAGVDQALRSSHLPLEPSTRDFMESRFNYDFSAVRVHTGSDATESTRAVNALAYKSGAT